MSFLMETGIYMDCHICQHKFNLRYMDSILIDGYFESVCKHCKAVIEKLRKHKPYGETGIIEK
jgi:hypothetical protein